MVLCAPAARAGFTIFAPRRGVHPHHRKRSPAPMGRNSGKTKPRHKSGGVRPPHRMAVGGALRVTAVRRFVRSAHARRVFGPIAYWFDGLLNTHPLNVYPRLSGWLSGVANSPSYVHCPVVNTVPSSFFQLTLILLATHCDDAPTTPNSAARKSA